LPLAEEKQYLLDAYKHYFSAQGQGSAEVLTAFAGLRVLPRSASSNFKRSRDTRLEADNTENPSLITIYGGKLTAYRATAQLVLKKLQASLPAPTKNIDTKDITLT
jgi:glycerol-3-phosphate dehydrogenase